MEIATGVPCNITKTEPSTPVNPSNLTLKKATAGKKIILRRLSLKASTILVYRLPYRKTPNMKMATTDVVFPSMCRGSETGVGMSNPTREKHTPARIDIIRGFLKSLAPTRFTPPHFVNPSSLYNSRKTSDIVTLTVAMKADDKVAKRSPTPGKANVTKGIPKKAKLPNIVLKVRR
jgi:hypothetical protein